MFQNGQKVVVVTGGDPTRVIKVQAGTGDPSRVPVVTTDGVLGRDQQVQVVSGGDSRRFPILNGVNPILALSPAAYYQFQTGVTVTGAGVSQWDDQSGNSRHLKQGTDTNRPGYNSGTGIITFDGSDNFLATDAFTFNQPETVLMVVNQLSWTSGDQLFDGLSNAVMYCGQAVATPTLRIQAGGLGPTTADLAVNTYGVLCAVFNGASSSLRVNNNAKSTGNVGASNAAGFTLCRNGGGNINFAHAGIKEVALFSSALSDADQNSVISYLMAKHSIT